jgi:tetratricopeptide (TPR) repeat protein
LALGRGEEAQSEQALAVEAFTAAAARAPDAAEPRRELAFALTRQGEMQGEVSGEWAQALPALERAAQMLAEMHAADPARMDYVRQHALVLERLGDARANMRDTARAGALYAQLLDLRRDLLARDPQNSQAQSALADALVRVGDAALAQGRPADALSAFDESRMLRARAAAARGGEEDADEALALARLWRQSAIARRRVGENEDWPGAYNSAVQLMRPLADAEGAATEIKRELIGLYMAYGDELGRSNRRAQAQRQWRAGLARAEAELVLNSDDVALNRDAARLRARLE